MILDAVLLLKCIQNGKFLSNNLSHTMRKSIVVVVVVFAYAKKRLSADQLRGNREADQRLCFRCLR